MKKRALLLSVLGSLVAIILLNSFTTRSSAPVPADPINYRVLREVGPPLCDPGSTRWYCMHTEQKITCDPDDQTPCTSPL